MFRPIHGHHQVDCLKFPLCKKFPLFNRANDDTLPRQKPPALPEEHIVLIPFTLSAPIEPIDTP